jgi:hypothetical protein
MDFQHEWIGHENDLEYIFSNLIEHVSTRCNAISDNPMAALYAQAFAAFPQAKFILSIRGSDKWVASVRKHVGDRPFVPAEKVQYWKYLDFKPKGLYEIDDNTLHALYRRHQKETIDFFSKHNALHQLCIINLDDDENLNSAILSDFLQISPPILFPWIDIKG